MKRFALMALASGLAIAAAAPANATVTISYSINGGAQTVLATDGGTGSFGYVGTPAGAPGISFNVGGFATPATASVYDLLTQSVNISSNLASATTVNIFITDTNLPAFSGNLSSSFTSNTLTNSSATISSFYNSTLMKATTFTTPGTSASGSAVSTTSPFSLTVRYDISFGAGNGNFNGTANVTAVPEAATWGMLILGFGLMGGALRSRKTKVAFA